MIHGYITSVEAPAAGELIVRVENGAWQGHEPATQFMAGNMALKIGEYSSELRLLTVVTEGESYSVASINSGTYTG